MKPWVMMAAAAVLAAGGAGFGPAGAQPKGEKTAAKKEMSADAKRGRYLVQVAGCNDCHTPGYAPSESRVDEKLWLTGDILGWRGPWGTTYPANLRLTAQKLTEDQWVALATSKALRPPMPWFNVRDMTGRDVRAIYRYLKWMGPAGQPAPAYVPPDKTPRGPFVQFPAPPPGGKPPAKK
ncbi:MAG TPA: cytochrome C [Alphaproteobacteria bacterium]